MNYCNKMMLCFMPIRILFVQFYKNAFGKHHSKATMAFPKVDP